MAWLCTLYSWSQKNQSVIRTSVTHSAVPCVPLFCCNPIWHHLWLIKQLLAEVEHDIMKYQCQDLSYLPKEKAEVDNADVRFNKNLVNQIFFSIVNLLNNLQKSDTSLWVRKILKILHVHGWRAWKLAKLWTWQLITQYLLQILGYDVNITYYWLHALNQSEFL